MESLGGTKGVSNWSTESFSRYIIQPSARNKQRILYVLEIKLHFLAVGPGVSCWTCSVFLLAHRRHSSTFLIGLLGTWSELKHVKGTEWCLAPSRCWPLSMDTQSLHEPAQPRPWPQPQWNDEASWGPSLKGSLPSRAVVTNLSGLMDHKWSIDHQLVTSDLG